MAFLLCIRDPAGSCRQDKKTVSAEVLGNEECFHNNRNMTVSNE